MTNIAMEIAICSWFDPLRMLVFHNHVSLPEGNLNGVIIDSVLLMVIDHHNDS